MKFQHLDKLLLNLCENQHLNEKCYERIFSYFLEGVHSYRNEECSRVFYPGVSGTRGEIVEGLEGFARTSSLMASWLAGGRSRYITLHDSYVFDIVQHLRNGLLNGTDPFSSGYWGEIENFDQRAVEAGDIAVTLWLVLNYSKDVFTYIETLQILSWLLKINEVELYGGNWCLFKVIVNLVASYFKHPSVVDIVCDYNEFKSFHVGDGWYGDGADGMVDYYNAWQMYYYLYWIDVISPNFDSAYIKKQVEIFSSGYKYFIGPQGVPIFGRSACYRISVSTPLIIDSALNSNNYGLAKRALEATWLYYIEHSSVKEGRVTQGYFSDKPHLLENYSGRASPLWSLRSLVIAFTMSDDHDFWLTTPTPLPVEVADYRIEIDGPGFILEGCNLSKSIKLSRNKTYFENTDSYFNIKYPSFYARALESLLKRPVRKECLNIKYGRSCYRSDDFYCD